MLIFLTVLMYFQQFKLVYVILLAHMLRVMLSVRDERRYLGLIHTLPGMSYPSSDVNQKSFFSSDVKWQSYFYIQAWYLLISLGNGLYLAEMSRPHADLKIHGLHPVGRIIRPNLDQANGIDKQRLSDAQQRSDERAARSGPRTYLASARHQRQTVIIPLVPDGWWMFAPADNGDREPTPRRTRGFTVQQSMQVNIQSQQLGPSYRSLRLKQLVSRTVERTTLGRNLETQGLCLPCTNQRTRSEYQKSANLAVSLEALFEIDCHVCRSVSKQNTALIHTLPSPYYLTSSAVNALLIKQCNEQTTQQSVQSTQFHPTMLSTNYPSNSTVNSTQLTVQSTHHRQTIYTRFTLTVQSTHSAINSLLFNNVVNKLLIKQCSQHTKFCLSTKWVGVQMLWEKSFIGAYAPLQIAHRWSAGVCY